MDYVNLIIAALGGYLLGSIPFGLVITKLGGLGDIRDIGSGNIGATNVLRTGRKDLAFLTLLGDAGKGGLAVLLARHFMGDQAALIAGVAAFAGHIWPIWLSFKGGKGVATYIGTLLALNWIVCLLFCATWLIVALLRRYSSLAALSAATAAPVFAYIWSGVALSAACAILSLILFYRHKDNILRLLDGTETKIGGDKTAKSES
ncbi:glycerol-3-phosphate 1-O-acyltransferase PlsY [Maritalea sp. S77]|uniref:glycerol-3-phosphate 1-O-acyltransferase PlsY n=1 Tax=Maritalea sp. S77 TaxID=3415125 RepID=UPI003C7C3A61